MIRAHKKKTWSPKVTMPGMITLNHDELRAELGDVDDLFFRLLAHLPHRRQRAKADVEVSTREDHQERNARPAGFIRAGEDAALVPEADPQARGHVAAEGDFEDGQDELAEGEDVGLADAVLADAGHAVLGRADELA